MNTKNKVIPIICMIGIGIAIVLFSILIYKHYTKTDYETYIKDDFDTQSNSVENFLVANIEDTKIISYANKANDVNNIELQSNFEEAASIRKETLYGVLEFTGGNYTDLKECFYNISNDTISTDTAEGYNTYAIVFTYNNTNYVAIREPQSQTINIVKRGNTQSAKAQEDFNKQHKKRDISTYDWSYLMRYREDATDEEIAYTLQANIVDVKIFDRPRDNIFTGDQFKCRYKYGFVIDNVNYYYDCIIDLDNGVVYTYVWRE